MQETRNIFKNADGTSMIFFLQHELIKNELLVHIIQIHGGHITDVVNQKDTKQIILGDPLNVNCKKLLDINEYYLDISYSKEVHRLMNEIKNNKEFSRKDDKILISYVHRPGVKRYDMEIYNKISKKYGKHLPYVWHDYYRFVLEPKLGPISLSNGNTRIEFNSINNNTENYFDSNSMFSKYFEDGFTSEEDYTLINFIKKSNLPPKGRLVFEKFHNLYPHRSSFSWRNRYVNVLLPLLNINSDFNCNSETAFSETMPNESEKYLYGATLNCVESIPEYDCNFDSNKDSKITYFASVNNIHDNNLKNNSIIKQSNPLDSSLIFPEILINKEIGLENSLSSKKKKILKEFWYSNLKDDELVPDEDDIMMLRQLIMQINSNICLLKKQEEIDQDSSIFNDKNIKNISEQGYSTPTNTDEISYLSTVSVDSVSPQFQINYSLQTPKSSSSLISTLYADKENFEVLTSPDPSNNNIIARNYQEISEVSGFNDNFLPNSIVLNSNIQNIGCYGNNLKNNDDLVLGEPDTLLEKTAHWYLRNMKKYGITQDDVTFALYKTSGVKKLAVIVMEAISRNLPLPNIEGIWTEEDDLVVYSGTSKQLKQVNQKHGGRLHNRIKFLQDYLDGNYIGVNHIY
ncbi:hypothetical protein PMAC_002261 [Pneumocystis sp. 'macacae']|nr:hypothetical protein PMAC_002261 [Pneumocystis sp. 'macacae']